MKKKQGPLRYEAFSDNESVYRARQRGLLVRETSPTYRLVDLFAGAGGLTLGFTRSFGQLFVPVWANDFNTYAANTYNANFGDHCTTDDILEVALALPLQTAA